jgi:hypothetical protein
VDIISPFKALYLDTGGAVSACRDLPLTHAMVTPTQTITVTSAFGHKQVCKVYPIDLHLTQSTSFTVNFALVEDLPFEALLGYQELKKLKATINLKTNQLIFPTAVIHIKETVTNSMAALPVILPQGLLPVQEL